MHEDALGDLDFELPLPCAVAPLRVLIVDDEQDLVDFLCILLSRHGFEASGTTDPLRVVEILKEGEYHLVILDMMMPRMSGTEVLKQIRKIDQDIAVIVSTAYPNLDTAIASVKHQVSDYVRKPFEPDVFLAAVREALERKGLSADAEAQLNQVIGEAVRTLRKARNLTLKQLARRSGLSMSYLSQIERSAASASIFSLYRIANAFGVKMAELLGPL